MWYYTELFKKHDIPVSNSVQTNLLKLNKEYYPVIRKCFDSYVGTSFDYLSKERIYPDGRNAYDDILSQILKLQQEGFRIHVICQLDRENIHVIPELYRFFNEKKINFALNRTFPPIHGTACASQIAHAITWQEYANTLCEIFDIWHADTENVSQITPLSGIFQSYLTECPRSCTLCLPDGMNYSSIGPGGEIYPCSCFDGEEHLLGTIYTDSPADIVRKRHEMDGRCITNDELGCPECECYGKLCLGGCFHARAIGWQREECNVYRVVWKHMDEVLKKMN
ncbi:MAG: SPASM domain-containing protein [Planctomycetia bacterium]|nr:SPASM domain-containing protein [Planctomycetia bacterium]